ncbi:hypothetical protein quinque_004029 [Culex quinquefasciatus]
MKQRIKSNNFVMSALCSNRSNQETVQRDHYVTTIKGQKYELTWAINRFSAWSARAESRHFFVKFPNSPAANIRWILVFNPKSRTDERYCAVFLRLFSPEDLQRTVPITYDIALLDYKSNVFYRTGKTASPIPVTVRGGAGGNAIKRETLLEKLTPGDKLVIKCTIEAHPEIVTSAVKEVKTSLPEALPSSFSKDLELLIGDGKFGDLTMMVDGEAVQAHKCILTARSPVFAAMFEHAMQESVENCVVIEDVELTVFKALLRYIYTDKVTCLDTMAQELYAAADKYGISTLKSLCRNSILEKLCPENAADTLKLADLHSDLEMKRYTLAFVSGSVAIKVTKTAGWQDMAKTHPHLVGEAFEALAARIPFRL